MNNAHNQPLDISPIVEQGSHPHGYVDPEVRKPVSDRRRIVIDSAKLVKIAVSRSAWEVIEQAEYLDRQVRARPTGVSMNQPEVHVQPVLSSGQAAQSALSDMALNGVKTPDQVLIDEAQARVDGAFYDLAA